jgi:peptide-methionine (S)-S-oxide reductase
MVGPAATRVGPAEGFYPAESYHQDFLAGHPDHPYIVEWDLPKLSALAHEFPAQYQAAPILVASR